MFSYATIFHDVFTTPAAFEADYEPHLDDEK